MRPRALKKGHRYVDHYRRRLWELPHQGGAAERHLCCPRLSETAEKTFKRAGTIVAAYLGIDLSSGDTPSGDGSGRILAYRERLRDDADASAWIMHPELRNAVLETL